MADHRILVLADDLTGALEVGAKFAAAGLPSLVLTQPEAFSGAAYSEAPAVVVDTETRHVHPAEAARCLSELARAALKASVTHVYKKTDSTLRGNIAAELEALIEVFGDSPLLYVPAYPQMGRTVRGGTLYVDGMLVGETSFARDPLNPVTESHIPTLLASRCRVPVRSIEAGAADIAPGCIAICDGATDADVAAAARWFVSSPGSKLVAGPAAIAPHLVQALRKPRGASPFLPGAANVLVVNGSLHGVSLRQVELAAHLGLESVTAITIPPCGLGEGWFILKHGGTQDVQPLGYAKDLAAAVGRILAAGRVDALVIFGGDTVYAIVKQLGHPPLFPMGELLEGIPISRVGRQHLLLVTKAGGFGPPNVIELLHKALEKT